jgi:hypothetical protein
MNLADPLVWNSIPIDHKESPALPDPLGAGLATSDPQGKGSASFNPRGAGSVSPDPGNGTASPDPRDAGSASGEEAVPYNGPCRPRLLRMQGVGPRPHP